MSNPITSLGFYPGQNLTPSLFSQPELAAAENLLQEYVLDNYPTLVGGRNTTLFDLNIRPRAVVYMISRAEWCALRQTQSLQGVIENPALASDDIVNAILSNYLITRRLGTSATGRIQVFVNTSATYNIPATTTFSTTSGLVFAPNASYRAIPNPSAANDIALVSADTSGTLFYFLVPVTAAAAGLASQLPAGAAVVMAPPVPNLVSAQAFGNFTGGTNDETNAQLIARIPQAQSVKNMATPLAISAVLLQQFPEITDVSVQRMNDPAMLRNSHNILGVKTGGYADIYVRTGAVPSTGSVNKIATLLDIDDNNNATYQVQLLRSDFPGNYFVTGVLDTADSIGSYTILSSVLGFNNLVDPNWNPLGNIVPNKIGTAMEAAYSAYQTTTIQFQVEYDSTLGSTPAQQFGATLSVAVSVQYLPLIQEIQQFVSSPSQGVVLSDYLVRAPIPCLVQFDTITVTAAAGTTAALIQQAIYAYVNGITMGNALRLDQVVAAILAVPGVQNVRLPIKARGSIYAPNGTTLGITGTSVLAIPNMPSIQVIPQTCAFFVQLADIPVSLIST